MDNTDSNPDVCSPDCGNGALSGIELCDDGNDVLNDGCTNCVIDDAYICNRLDSTDIHPDVCTLRCGNSALDPHGSH